MFHVKIQKYHPIETNIDVFQVLQFLLGSNELGLSVSSLNPANNTVSWDLWPWNSGKKSIQPQWGGSTFLAQIFGKYNPDI